MTDSSNDPAADYPTGASPEPLPLSPRPALGEKYAVLAFVAPLVVYMVVPMFFNTTAPGDHLAPEHVEAAQARYAANHLNLATTRAALLVPLLAFLAWAIYLPKLRVSLLAIVVGVVGVVLWVGIDAVGIRQAAAGLFGEESSIGSFLFPERDALNPYELYGVGTFKFWQFLITRFIGLALIVPIVEELMLRGWMVRLIDNPAFWEVKFGESSLRAVAAGVAFATLYHPEKLAAVVWFGLTMWLMLKTKNFWDCVAAHAVTNLLLGVWVLWRGQWELW
ncbi:MAG: CAAX prenyl protease-related protein [Planctomycetota bacterium]